jgi:hypothetical protein
MKTTNNTIEISYKSTSDYIGNASVKIDNVSIITYRHVIDALAKIGIVGIKKIKIH